MKKNLLWMLAAILLCGVTTTSCSEDDDNNGNSGTNKTTAVEVSYGIQISNATKISLQKAFTFTIEYYDQSGNLVSVEPLKYGNIEWRNSFNINKFPGKFGIRVTAAPKADLSAVLDGEYFDIIYQFEVNGKPMNADGEYLDNVGRDGTVKYPQVDVKAVAADGEKFVDTFFFDVDVDGKISTKIK